MSKYSYPIMYRGSSDYMSHFYPASIRTYNGESFTSAEQLYHVTKVRSFMYRDPHKNESICRELLAESDGPSLKRISRDADIDKKCWDATKSAVMCHIDYLKFHQNPALASQLLATENRPLIENVPFDRFWGIPNNAAGHCLMGCRRHLRSQDAMPSFMFISDILAHNVAIENDSGWNMNVPRLTLDFVSAVAPLLLQNSRIGIALLCGFVDVFNEDYSLNPANKVFFCIPACMKIFIVWHFR